jgi:hypothetical protein
MNTFLHPVDSAAGMAGGIWDMWEHTPVIGSGFKMLHGAKDIATGNEHGAYGNNWSDLNKNLSPGNSIDNDIDFWAGIGGGRDAWAKDPLEAGTRTLTNFAPLILGAAEGIGGGGERPWDPSQPVDLEVRNSNPDLVRQPDPNTQPARRPGQFFNDPLPQKQGPSELDQIRVKVAEQRGGGAEFSKKNARRR